MIMVQMVCKRTSEGYNLRLRTDFSLLQVKSLNHDLKALQYFVPKIWNILPSGIANSRTHQEFSKKKFKSWIPRNCSLRICEKITYIK